MEVTKNLSMFMVTLSVAVVDHFKRGAAKGQVTALKNHHHLERRVQPMISSKSIITMTYLKKGKLPRRVKAVVNLPKSPVSKTNSLVIDASDYVGHKTIEELHALAAWRLAVQLSWIYPRYQMYESGHPHGNSEDGDLIPARIHRVGTTGIGQDHTVWVLNDNTTARKLLNQSRARSSSSLESA